MPSVLQASRVLVFRTGHLGDTVCAIPAFRRIRDSFPAAQLSLLCDAPHGSKVPAAEVVGPLNIFDRILSYRPERGFKTVFDLIRSIWAVRPGTIVMLPQQRATPDAIRAQRRFFRMCGVRDIRGYEPLAAPGEWRLSEPDRLIEILRRAGVPGNKPDYAIPTDVPASESVGECLRSVGIRADEGFLAFCGGGKVATQRWPLDRYAEVLRGVAADLRWPIVAFGTPAEMEGYRRELSPLCPDLKLLPQALTIASLIELLRRSSAYLGNDTGPMHVAAAVSCPVAVVMSARNAPGAWDPDVNPRLVIRHRTECEGCFLSECSKEKHRCMTAITPAEVLASLLPFLKSLPVKPRLVSVD